MPGQRFKSDVVLQAALRASRESKTVDFKAMIDLDASGDLIELLKDLVSMSNSGGGVVLIGVLDDGRPSGWNAQEFLAADSADLINRFSKYVGESFDCFEVVAAVRDGEDIAAVIVSPCTGSPFIFERPGTYDMGEGKQKTAFGKGTIYFRHGSKSEHAGTKDILRFIQREVSSRRREWLQNVRKVVSAPMGATVFVGESLESSDLSPREVRLTDNPNAPESVPPDVTHPYRLKELLAEMARRLPGSGITGHQIQCVRKVYQISERPEFFYKPRFGSPQYSVQFADWMEVQYSTNAEFFTESKYRAEKQSGEERHDGGSI